MRRVISVSSILVLLFFQIGCVNMNSQPEETSKTEKTIQEQGNTPSQNKDAKVITFTNNKKALIKAITLGDAETTKQLLQKGIDADAKDSNGLTALMMASEMGHTDIVRLLLEKGVELDVKDNTGSTALMKAIKNNQIEIIEMLLSAGAGIESLYEPPDINGNWAYPPIKEANKEIHSLFQKRNEEIGNFHSAKYRPTNEGVFETDEQRHSFFESLKKLKEHIQTLKNTRSALGNTPLLLAVKGGYYYVKDLITADNINMADPFQKSALIIAVTKNELQAVEQLIAAGADVNYKDRFGQTPLRIAQEKGFTEIANILKTAGAKE